MIIYLGPNHHCRRLQTIYVTDMDQWQAIPDQVVVMKDPHGRPCHGFKQVDACLPVLQSSLLKGIKLTMVEMGKIRQHIGLEVDSTSLKKAELTTLHCNAVFKDNADRLGQALSAMKNTSS